MKALILAACSLLLAACQTLPPEKKVRMLEVHLKERGLKLADAQVLDEPPAVARFVVFKSGQHELRFHLKRSPALFSENRQWSESVLLTAKVTAIELTRPKN